MSDADRFEFKFLISACQRDALLHELGPAMRPDLVGGAGGNYPVVSLYYDSPDLTCFWDAWRGVPSRRKLRIRVYGSADGSIPATSFLEIKQKVDGRGVKRRFQTSLDEALAIAAGKMPAGLVPAAQRVVCEVRSLIAEKGFRPVCAMRYSRQAWALDATEAPAADPLRVTFDDALFARFDNLVPEPDDRRFSRAVLPAGHLIMELKGSGNVPYTLSRKLARLGISPRSFSKYFSAVDLHKRVAYPVN